MRFLAVLAAVVVVASAAIVRRDCNPLPSSPDPAVRDQIYEIALDMGVNSKVMLIMMATAITESYVNNLPCGDQDSLGVFQQRPSQGWGTPEELLNVTYSTHAFLNVAIPLEASNPNTDAGVIAQMVQDAQAGNRYTGNEGLAEQFIALAAAAVGRNPPPSTSAPASAPAAPKPSQSSSPKPSAPAPAAPQPSSPPAPAPPAFPAPLAPIGEPYATMWPASVPFPPFTPSKNAVIPLGACSAVYTPVAGDTCISVSQAFGIPLPDFYELNPTVNDTTCGNLDVSQSYCVSEPNAGASS